MTKVAKGDIEDGLNMMKPYSVVPTPELDVVIGNVSLQIPAMTQRFGKSIGKEFIQEDAIGQHLVRLVYLNTFENHAMQWVFYFYKGPHGWRINKFVFNDNVHEMFTY